MAPVQSFKFQTANFPIFCTRIIAIFWTTCIARGVFFLVIKGNLTHILPVLQWPEVVIGFVSSFLCYFFCTLICIMLLERYVTCFLIYLLIAFQNGTKKCWLCRAQPRFDWLTRLRIYCICHFWTLSMQLQFTPLLQCIHSPLIRSRLWRYINLYLLNLVLHNQDFSNRSKASYTSVTAGFDTWRLSPVHTERVDAPTRPIKLMLKIGSKRVHYKSMKCDVFIFTR